MLDWWFTISSEIVNNYGSEIAIGLAVIIFIVMTIKVYSDDRDSPVASTTAICAICAIVAGHIFTIFLLLTPILILGGVLLGFTYLVKKFMQNRG